MSTNSETEEQDVDIKEANDAGEENSKPVNGNSSTTSEIKEEFEKLTLERCLPRVNCEEHIVFVVDLCKEENSSKFQLSEGSSYSFLYMVKRALSLFLYNKKAINSLHTFSLVVLQESPVWVINFTSNPKDIINELESLNEVPSSSNFDLSQLFNLIKNQITLPSEAAHVSLVPPPFVVRTILLYGRSHCLPQFLSGKESFNQLMKSPYFFIDVLYAHEPPAEDTKCEGIFDLLCDLDTTGWNYIVEVGRNATKFHNLFSVLLAHPLQRPSQKDAHHTLATKEAASWVGYVSRAADLFLSLVGLDVEDGEEAIYLLE